KRDFRKSKQTRSERDPDCSSRKALGIRDRRYRRQSDRLSISASDCAARATRRGGRRTDVPIPISARKSQNPARQPRQTPVAERIRQDAVVVAARNCNWALERGTAQPYLYRRSSAAHFQTRMRILP